LFAQFGVPEVLVTDNGSCFVSSEFENFLLKNGIKHITSAPYHPATNGLAERAVQIVKKGLKKEAGGSMVTRLAKVLMAYRTTPQSTTGMSPSELLQGRRMRTRLDLLKPSVSERVELRQLRQKLSHDSLVRGKTFSKGETVYARNFGTGEKWQPAVIEEVTGPVSVIVKLQDGSLVRRHYDHLRHRVARMEMEISGESIPVQEEMPEEIVPDVLIEASPTTPSSPVTSSPTDAGTADSSADTAKGSGQTTERNGPVEGPHTEEHAAGSTSGTATAKAGTRTVPSNSGITKTYPKRHRRHPDWYHNY